MTRKLRYAIFKTNMGWFGILGSAKGLLSINLPQRSEQKARQLLGDKVNGATWSPVSFEDLVARFRTYLDGHRVTFPDKLDLSSATPFQREVWKMTRIIPYGETRSYTWVAAQVKKAEAVRAVGQALGRNPLPIIVPCHRVLTSGGSLGGYRGGIEMKKHLLSLEASV